VSATATVTELRLEALACENADLRERVAVEQELRNAALDVAAALQGELDRTRARYFDLRDRIFPASRHSLASDEDAADDVVAA
jgi:hypothetical protein